MTAAKLRCAIYTRKSSEEGLEQDFNSLHAQREACEAYVRSQAGEGWAAISTLYDDGGFSGGSLERPALKHLLGDIAAGKVDVVVVYKVDRLTRSLTDFAKIVETFDARGVSFVSVTQSFNTTTSMGRLTLNVLLSFAQFEREVTGERIRDKIAASKAKGMWMGGMLPLGYDLNGRTLSINPVEAQTVRHIFDRYLEVGSVKELAVELADAGVRSKAWTTRAGKSVGGLVMERGAVLHILQSRLYVGEIVHKGQAHPGQHPGLISRDAFDAVAAKLATKAVRRREGRARATSGPLTGILIDANGQPMSPSFGYGKSGKPYRYYIAMALQVASLTLPADGAIRRVSATAVEGFLCDQLRRLADRPLIEVDDLARLLRRVEIRTDEIHLVIDTAEFFPDEHPDLCLSALKRRIREGEQVVPESGTPGAIRVVLPQRLQLRGGRTRIVGGDEETRSVINPGIVVALKRAHTDLIALKASPLSPPDEQRDAIAPVTQYERQLGRLAFLAPELQRRILAGDQPRDLTLRAILKNEMPLAWADQTAWLERISRT